MQEYILFYNLNASGDLERIIEGILVAKLGLPAAGQHLIDFDFELVIRGLLAPVPSMVRLEQAGKPGHQPSIEFEENGIPSIGKGRFHQLFDRSGDIEDEI